MALHRDDADQTVSVGEAARVRTCYGPVGTVCGAASSEATANGLVVRGDLRGPELRDPIGLTTSPGGSFTLPGFQTPGDYLLENVRLEDSGGRILAPADPSIATVHVRQILLTSARVTTLSLAELQARGITLTQQNFKAFGNVLSESRSDGTTFERTFDQKGNLKTERIGNIQPTRYEYDGAAKLTKSVTPAGATLTLGYDKDGRVKSRMVSGSGSLWKTAYTYDVAHSGRLTRVTYPDQTHEDFTSFDDDDVVKEWTDRYGQHVVNVVDDSNRLLSTVPSGAAAGVDSYSLFFTYDGASRLTKMEKGGRSGATVTSSFDLGGRPIASTIGALGSFERTFDTWDGALTTKITGSAVASQLGDPLLVRTFDALRRPATVKVTQGANGLPLSTLTWGGVTDLKNVRTPGATGATFEQKLAFKAPGLAKTVIPAAAGKDWGTLELDYAPGDGFKTSRATPPASPTAKKNAGLLSNQEWSFTPDGPLRLGSASSGKAGALERFGFGYGARDELLSLTTEKNAGVVSLVPAADGEGRIGTRDSAAFTHDALGNRTEDDRYVYTWSWRGELTSLTVKPSWPSPPGTPSLAAAIAGHKAAFEYDALGRLISRVETNETGAFIEARDFLWDGGTLLSEAGRSDNGSLRWRRTYLPGPSGMDDSLQLRLENFGAGTEAQIGYWGFLRDEQGNVLGLIDQNADPSGKPPVPVKFFYTPLGAAHVDVGPELLKAEFSTSLTGLGGAQQSPPGPNQSVAGGLAFFTSSSFDAATLAGAVVERWSVDSAEWQTVSRDGWIVDQDADDATKLVLIPRDCWPKASRFRARLTRDLKDDLGRAFVAPEGKTEFELVLEIPSDGVTAPVYARTFPFEYETFCAASETLNGRFPGGTNILFQSGWTDPFGLQYKRARWYSPRDGTFVSSDPAGSVDSLSLYAYTGWRPHEFVDPSGAMEEVSFMAGMHMAGYPQEEIEAQYRILRSGSRIGGAFGRAFGRNAMGIGAVGFVYGISPPVAVGLGVGLLVKSAMDAAGERVAEGESGLQAAAGAPLDVLGVSQIYAGVTNEDIITGEALGLSDEQQEEVVGEGLGNVTSLALAGPLFRLGAGAGRGLLSNAVPREDLAVLKSIRRHGERLVTGRSSSSSPAVNLQVRAIRRALARRQAGRAGSLFHSLNFRFARQAAIQMPALQALLIEPQINTPLGSRLFRKPDYQLLGGVFYDIKPWRSNATAFDTTPQFQDIFVATGRMPIPLYYRLRR